MLTHPRKTKPAIPYHWDSVNMKCLRIRKPWMYESLEWFVAIEKKKKKERTSVPDSTRSGARILNETAGVSWIPLAVLQDRSEGLFCWWLGLSFGAEQRRTKIMRRDVIDDDDDWFGHSILLSCCHDLPILLLLFYYVNIFIYILTSTSSTITNLFLIHIKCIQNYFKS